MTEETVVDTTDTTCCVVGGGPAGLMLAYLLARQNVSVQLLESHHDFDRDFRGDTVHPSTLEILDQLGLADRLHQLPHGRIEELQFNADGQTTTVADFRRLKTKYQYVMVMPQAKYLDFMATAAKELPSFRLVLGANVQRLVQENGVTKGVRYRDANNAWHEVRAALTVGADGRFSKIRSLAGVEPVKSSPPMDVIWFRMPRKEADPADRLSFYISGGVMAFVLDRGTEWQIGYVIAKGSYSDVKAAGLDKLRTSLGKTIPWMANRVDHIQDWKQITVLSVESSRVPTWHQPGLLLIGDAAHVMSPVGGVGINYAIQDAVETANLLGDALKKGSVTDEQLAEVQRVREWPVKVIQRFQGLVQQQIVSHALRADQTFRMPLAARVLLKIPVLRDLPAKIIAFGPRRVRVKGLP